MRLLLIEAGIIFGGVLLLCALLAAVDKACDRIERAGNNVYKVHGIERAATCPAPRRRGSCLPPTREIAQEAHASFCVRERESRTADFRTPVREFFGDDAA